MIVERCFHNSRHSQPHKGLPRMGSTHPHTVAVDSLSLSATSSRHQGASEEASWKEGVSSTLTIFVRFEPKIMTRRQAGLHCKFRLLNKPERLKPPGDQTQSNQSDKGPAENRKPMNRGQKRAGQRGTTLLNAVTLGVTAKTFRPGTKGSWLVIEGLMRNELQGRKLCGEGDRGRGWGDCIAKGSGCIQNDRRVSDRATAERRKLQGNMWLTLRN